MLIIGAFEAKTHLSSLLDRVAHGEEIVITKYGKPIAKLVSAAVTDRQRVDQAIAAIKALRRGHTLGDLSWRDLRDEGRR